MRRVLVWDLPTRIFHWALFVLVAVAYLTGEDEGVVHQVHVAAGYGIGALILFRVIWGFVGSAHSRFADFARNLRDLPAYLPGLLRLRPRSYVGHNPLGILMIAAMTATLVGVLVTGLYGGEELHELLANLIVILATVHVAGVLLDSLLTGENLIAAMIGGRKPLSAEAAEREPRPAPRWRALAAVAATVLVVVGGFMRSEALTWPPPTQGELEDAEHGEAGEHEGEYED